MAEVRGSSPRQPQVVHKRSSAHRLGCRLAPGRATADHCKEDSSGNLLLSTSEYTPASITPGVTELPPGCTGTACTPAIADGSYPLVFNNDTVDPSFGVTSRVSLDELTPWGQGFGRIPVPSRDVVTSFSSKSELALNLSTNGQDVTFLGYRAPVAAIDVSNSAGSGGHRNTRECGMGLGRELSDRRRGAEPVGRGGVAMVALGTRHGPGAEGEQLGHLLGRGHPAQRFAGSSVE